MSNKPITVHNELNVGVRADQPSGRRFVFMSTDDGHLLAITPKLARQLATELVDMANSAELIAVPNWPTGKGLAQ